MKNIILVLVFVLGFANIYADGINEGSPAETPAPVTTVTGKVVDIISGESLAGAEVRIEGSNLVTYTDLDGNFNFSNIKSGTYSIVVTFISYKNSLVENLSISTSNSRSLEVQLVPESN